MSVSECLHHDERGLQTLKFTVIMSTMHRKIAWLELLDEGAGSKVPRTQHGVEVGNPC
ncbi:hypothetical protein LBMAG03_13320 [Actinomycetes bacterium]|nr:hypothetical protein LBMAG03_13320 [Actinomycetes bacterium]